MITVAGEALVDLVPIADRAELTYVARAGGSPYNVAIGLARLNQATAYLGPLSHDHFGHLLRSRLISNGVELVCVEESHRPTALAVVQFDSGHEPEFTIYGELTADRFIELSLVPSQFPRDTTALHFGSISLLREPAASVYVALMERETESRTICLDPNIRPSLIENRGQYADRFAHWLTLVDVLKVSIADLDWLRPNEALEVVVESWLRAGPSLVVVTRGRDGAVAFTGDSRVTVPGFLVDVADTVGAGDGFMAGLLARLNENDWLAPEPLTRIPPDAIFDCLQFANAVAALTCTKVGVEPPSLDEVRTLLMNQSTWPSERTLEQEVRREEEPSMRLALESRPGSAQDPRDGLKTSQRSAESRAETLPDERAKHEEECE